MWPDEGWVEALSSIQRPLPSPPNDPTTAPFKSVNVNCSWLPYIRAALMALTFQTTWKATGPALTLAQKQAMTLVSLFEECSGELPAFSCPYPFSPDAATGTPWVPAFIGDPSAGGGSFIPTIGWDSTIVHSVGGAQWYNFVSIRWTFPSARQVGIVQCSWANLIYGNNYLGHLSDGSNKSGIRVLNGSSVVGSALFTASTLSAPTGTITQDFGNLLATAVELTIIAGISATSSDPGHVDVVFASVSGHSADTSCP